MRQFAVGEVFHYSERMSRFKGSGRKKMDGMVDLLTSRSRDAKWARLKLAPADPDAVIGSYNIAKLRKRYAPRWSSPNFSSSNDVPRVRPHR